MPRANYIELLPTKPTRKVHQSLIDVANNAGKLNSMRYYLLLGYLDTAGRGAVHIDYAIQQLSGHLKVKRETVARNIESICDLGFASRAGNLIYYKSQKAVAELLGAETFTNAVVKLPFDQLTGSIGDIRALAYETIAHADGNTKSRRTIREMTGASRTTQLRYDNRRGITHRRQYVDGGKPTEQRMGQLRSEGKSFFVINDKLGKLGERNQKRILINHPNAYTSTLERSTNRRVPPSENNGSTGKKVRKLEYSDKQRAYKAFTNEHDIFYPITNEEKFNVLGSLRREYTPPPVNDRMRRAFGKSVEK